MKKGKVFGKRHVVLTLMVFALGAAIWLNTKYLPSETKYLGEASYVNGAEEKDAVETAARYGIGADRAVNYNADKEGTSIVYESVSKAVCNVRACAPLSADWSNDINEDYVKRGKKW